MEKGRNGLGIAQYERVDDEDYQQRLEKHRKRAERFGTEMKEPAFPGRVPSHKRHFNTNQPTHSTLSSQDLPMSEISAQDKRQARQQRFAQETEEISSTNWVRDAFYALVQASCRQNNLPYDSEAKLPKENVRLAKNDTNRRPYCLHLYGVDSLSTEDIFGFFTSFPPDYVEWLDDSACNVVFCDDERMEGALNALSTPFTLPDTTLFYSPPPSEEPTPDEEEANESHDSEANEEQSKTEEPAEEKENDEETNDSVPEDTEAPMEDDEDKKEDQTPETLSPEEITDLLPRWRAARLSTSKNPHLFVIRYSTTDDKRLDFKTRLARYQERHGIKPRGNRRGRDGSRRRRDRRGDTPYERSSPPPARPRTQDPDMESRARRMTKSALSSILNN